MFTWLKSGLMLFGRLVGGGRSSFVAWVWIGMVMMNMMSRTSMTSINGVVFISPIGLSSPPPDPTDIPMIFLRILSGLARCRGAGSR